MDKKRYLRRKSVIEQLNHAVQENHIVYVGAHTGWGKTASAQMWMEDVSEEVLYLSIHDGIQEQMEQICHWVEQGRIVIDDVYGLSDEDEKLLSETIMSRADCHFLILGRIMLPAWLKIYQIKNQLCELGIPLLQFEKKDILRYLKQNNLNASDITVEHIMDWTSGWPASISMLISRMSRGEELTFDLMERIIYDVYEYFDANILRTWNLELQHFIMTICDFDQISTPMACAVSGRSNAGSLLKELLRHGSFLKLTPPDTYVIHDFFQRFLVKKRSLLYSQEKINRLYYNAAIYYEQSQRLDAALKYYKLAGDTDKIGEILMRIANMHEGKDEFYDLEEYYQTLSMDEIIQSPELMSGMCMMKEMAFLPEEAEEWYGKLVEFKNKVSKNDGRYKMAIEKLAYLEVAMPNRGSRKLVTIIHDVAGVCKENSFCLQEMNVTGNCPSLLHGGKDVSEWMTLDGGQYRGMKSPLETILGSCGIGLFDIAMGENLYEKNRGADYFDAVIKLSNGLAEAEERGTNQMRFAGKGILGRIFAAEGNLNAAMEMMGKFRTEINGSNNQLLIGNVDAYLAKLWLYSGDEERARYLLGDVPDETVRFRIVDHYRYMMKVRLYLIEKQYIQAIGLLQQLSRYYKAYDRTYDELEAGLFKALVFYRRNSRKWRREMERVVKECEKLHIYHLISDEGIAVLPMLEELSYHGSQEFFAALLQLTRKQAKLYPNYCQQHKEKSYDLNEKEKIVLELLGQGMSNAQIAGELNITVRTVKFHLTNIYQELEVSNRTQALNAARESNLLL